VGWDVKRTAVDRERNRIRSRQAAALRSLVKLYAARPAWVGDPDGVVLFHAVRELDLHTRSPRRKEGDRRGAAVRRFSVLLREEMKTTKPSNWDEFSAKQKAEMLS
jgi:hypothetical protein